MSVVQIFYQKFIYQPNVISGHKYMAFPETSPDFLASVGLFRSLSEDIGSRNNFWVFLFFKKNMAIMMLIFCPILEKMRDS